MSISTASPTASSTRCSSAWASRSSRTSSITWRRFEEGGAAGLAMVVGVRGLLTPFLHPFFTMFTGIALGLVVSRRGAVRWIVPLAGYFVAVFMHALWNSGIGMLLYPVLFVPGICDRLGAARAPARPPAPPARALRRARGCDGADRRRCPRTPSHAGSSLRVALASMRTSDHPLHRWRELNHAAYTLAMHRHDVVRRWHNGSPANRGRRRDRRPLARADWAAARLAQGQKVAS